MSWDSHWKFGHALCCSQIWATPAELRSVTKLCCQQRACQWWKCWWKHFKEHHHKWWNLGLWLCCQNKSPLFTMGLKNITQTQKSKASLVQCECDADCVFWFWGHNTSWISTSWPGNEQGILSMVMKSCKRQWGENGLICVCVCVGGLLHNDNAPVHYTLLFCDFLTKHKTTLISQPLHLPDLAKADFFLFTKLKSVTKGWWFESDEEIKETSLAELCSVPKQAFHIRFQNWKKRWEQCIKSGEEYFKGKQSPTSPK